MNIPVVSQFKPDKYTLGTTAGDEFLPESDGVETKLEKQVLPSLVVTPSAEQAPAEENSSGAAGNGDAAPVKSVQADSVATKSLLSMPLDEFFTALDKSTPEEIEKLLAQGNSKVHLPIGVVRNVFKPLFAVPEGDRSALNVVAWWESRRIVYNLVVGVCGLPTLMFLFAFNLAPIGMILFGTIEYAIVANACFTLGWMAELLTRCLFAEKSKHMGPMLLTLGIVFSTAITLAAAVVLPLAFFILIAR